VARTTLPSRELIRKDRLNVGGNDLATGEKAFQDPGLIGHLGGHELAVHGRRWG
jgi:hypothetical protein